MKKLLLISACALASISAMQAQEADTREARILPAQAISYLSPDGRFATSEFYSSIVIFDLQNDNSWTYAASDTNEYSGGVGRSWSNNGIFVASVDNIGTPSYWQDGKWYDVPNPDDLTCFLYGINAPGNTICGLRATGKDSEKEVQYTPWIWTLQEDGTWGEPEALPYPDLDFTGRHPQYVTATNVSDDGRVITGQIVDYTGWLLTGIVYTKDEKGEWSYRQLGLDLVNPNNIVFPEYPGEYPAAPDPMAYMTSDEFEAYQTAVKNAGLSYVDPVDFIQSEESKQKYEAAKAEYDAVLAEYLPKFNAFYDALQEVNDVAVQIVMNSGKATPDCKKLAFTAAKSEQVDPNDRTAGTITRYSLYEFDTTTGQCTKLPEDETNPVLISDIAADGTMFGVSRDAKFPNAYVLKPGAEAWIPLQTWMESVNKTTYDWMADNMVHDIFLANEETGATDSFYDTYVTGTPFCTPDLSLVATYAQRIWDEGDTEYVYSYLLPAGPSNAIHGIQADGESNTEVRYYDMMGQRVLNPTPGQFVIRLQGDKATKQVAR